ncbi:MAG: ABC transporter permease [Dehalococcoidia bacterium]
MSQATSSAILGTRGTPRLAGLPMSAVREVVHFARRKPLGAAGAAIVLLMIVVAIFAPVIAPYDYDYQVLSQRLRDPSVEHVMGTDNLGRDIFSRIVYGARISITIGFVAVAIQTCLVTVLGVISGYYGRWLDLIFQRFIDIWIAMPGLLALIFFISVFGPSMATVIILLGTLGAAGGSRVVRSAVIAVRAQPYIEAARVIGASDRRVMLVHVLPNVLHVVVIGSTVAIGAFILAEASLAFLGFGVPPPYPTWGQMLNVSREYLYFPWLALWPGLALTATVFGFNVFGDALRDVLDPRLRRS